jgi:hypothetical protein
MHANWLSQHNSISPLAEGMAIAVAKMAAKQMSPAQIASILEMDMEVVRQAMTNGQ